MRNKFPFLTWFVTVPGQICVHKQPLGARPGYPVCIDSCGWPFCSQGRNLPERCHNFKKPKCNKNEEGG